ncbi:MAG: hypothetical protein V7L20_07440 [Nostoc sp.]|uniref:hypothetical protein n=1 Tax=Nostoc sp. TaxID=1180 RepID=UPI002FFBCC7C
MHEENKASARNAVGWGASALGGSADLKQLAFEQGNPTLRNVLFVGLNEVKPNKHLFLSPQSDKRA